MLYVFTGTDTARAKTEARTRTKKAELVVFGEGALNIELAPSYLASQGLFTPAFALMLDRPLDSAESKALLKEHAKAFHESAVPVFIIAPTLSAVDKKLFPKGVVFEEFAVKGAKEAPRPNVFAFTDTVLKGDRKAAWIQYRKLIAAGIVPEEIHGTLSWAARSVLIAGKTNSAAEAGLKPFVFTKSKRVFDKLGAARAESLSRELVHTYHHARMGKGNLELKLEQLILEQI